MLGVLILRFRQVRQGLSWLVCDFLILIDLLGFGSGLRRIESNHLNGYDTTRHETGNSGRNKQEIDQWLTNSTTAVFAPTALVSSASTGYGNHFIYLDFVPQPRADGLSNR